MNYEFAPTWVTQQDLVSKTACLGFLGQVYSSNSVTTRTVRPHSNYSGLCVLLPTSLSVPTLPESMLPSEPSPDGSADKNALGMAPLSPPNPCPNFTLSTHFAENLNLPRLFSLPAVHLHTSHRGGGQLWRPKLFSLLEQFEGQQVLRRHLMNE